MYYETHYAPLLQMQGFVNEIALEVRRADGTVRPVVASARQLRDADGVVTVNRVALFDSSDRRRYERELLVARKKAEAAVATLADADRRRNEFIAVIGHELRNPLAPIRSGVDILRRAARADPIVATTTSMMERQVLHMARLIEDLLDVSRLGQDTFALHRVSLDLASVVHHVAEVSRPLLDSVGVAFVTRVPAEPVYVNADAARLAQAIVNVLNNAAKFTPRGGSVTLALERTGPDAVIRVRDTGIGIAGDQLATVFELFMQVDRSVERRGGLGIGLTLAKTLIERHDGRIAVHSDGLGQGTEIVMRLPAREEALDGVTRAFSSPGPDDAAPAARRVLIVDDNRDSAELMKLSLSYFGHDIRLAYDGLEAVDTAAAFQPHVVLLDIGLPLLNGYEAAARIRAQAATPPLLVALTGWGQDEDRRKSAAAGFDRHLVKPVDYDVLTTLIAELERPEPRRG
jgi:signal transduction histidine kinase/CheY-like chemotaxis protein